MTSMTSDGSGAARPCIDTLEFARSGTTLAATQQPSDFPRLLELLANADGRIGWSLSGEFRPSSEGAADAYLRLRIQGSVCLACIRCLQPVRAEFDERRLFKITATESQAEREDAETDDYDALVGSTSFDVLDLVEDEVILALPIAPRHQDCSLPAGAEGRTGEMPERPAPFAALAALKAQSSGEGQDGGGSR